MIIAVDFDGTCVTHEFPKIGKEIGATEVLKELTGQGHKLILNTMRSDDQKIGNLLTDAVNWFIERDIPLFGINKNPEQDSWTSSPKPYAHLYIDDAALGCPLIYSKDEWTFPTPRPYADWEKIKEYLYNEEILINNK
jgi:hypothetical protein